ncbi:MAG: response regulator transcription factor [Clostridiales bacterium]|nr:response regulator transcription factor [Clostridiales bacterium]
MKQILIVDDDVSIGDMLEEILTKEGYGVNRAYSGTEALLLLSLSRPDLVLLDLMLPGLNGEEVLPKISGIPVIVLSAKVDVDNKVDVLLNGAADYMTKPFDIKELLARIVVQFRDHSQKTDGNVLKFEGVQMNTVSHVVSVEEHGVRLTKTEYAILKLLMQNPTQVITKSLMLDRISEDTPDCMESSLNVHISNLRKKLRDVNGRDYIETV